MYKTILTFTIMQGVTYKPCTLSNTHITSILSETQIFPVQEKLSAPADISFICADLKFDGETIKFCELGNAIYMFYTHDMKMLVNEHVVEMNAPGWSVFWHYLKQFNKPIWFVGKIRDYNADAIDILNKLGGKHVESLDMLSSDDHFKQQCKPNFKQTNTIADYSGIIIYRAHDDNKRTSEEVETFRSAHQDFIFVNAALQNIVSRKDSTHEHFKAAGLQELLPKTRILPKQYTQAMIDDVLSTIQSTYFVLKPVAGSCSIGVMVTKRETLKETINWLLQKKQWLKKRRKPYVYDWRYDTSDSFMISEYVPSKLICRDNRWYDPTMRVMMVLRHDHGVIHLTILGGFWKIPIKPIDAKGSLTEKHVTGAHLVVDNPDEFYSGILVDKQDMEKVKANVYACIPTFYKAALKISLPLTLTMTSFQLQPS